MLDDALRRAGQVGRAGGVAWLIEGDDKTRLGRGLIEQTLRKRGPELEMRGPAGGPAQPSAAPGVLAPTRRARRVARSGATR